MNGKEFDFNNINSAVMMGYGLEEGKPITLKVHCGSDIVELNAPVHLNYMDVDGLKYVNESKKALKGAWLKGNF